MFTGPLSASLVRCLSAVIIALTVISSDVPAARAQPVSDHRRGGAEALFEEGRVLKERGQCAAALEKFLPSQDLAPAVGTQLNIADCYTALGRTASAWTYFREAANAARSQGDDRRADYASRRAEELAPTLCRLRLEVTQAAPDQELTRNGEVVERAAWGNPVPVDPGEHTLRASAPGRLGWQGRVLVSKPGSVVRLTVPELARAPTPSTPNGMHPQAVSGWAVVGAGGAAMVIGVALGIRARVLDDASLDYCPDDPNRCLPEGAELRTDARTLEQGAVVALAAGAAAVGVGLTVAFTAPRAGASEARLAATPWWSAHHGGILMRVSW